MDNALILYAIFYRIVHGWPATYHSTGPEERFKRLNTFAVVEDEAQLFADNLSKDSRYKPTQSGEQFFSRHWQAHNYRDAELKKELPALLVWEEPGNLEVPLTSQEHELLKLRLCIQGRHVAAYEPGAYTIGKGEQRTVEEVKENLRLLRSQLHAELRKWCLVEVEPAGGGAWQSIWINEEHLATLIPGTYQAQRKKRMLTNWLRINDTEATIIANVDANGLVHAYSSLEVLLEPCTPVAIDHTATEPLELLDHPTNASA